MIFNSAIGQHVEGGKTALRPACCVLAISTTNRTLKVQQDVNTLSRDVEHAANALMPMFDKEEEPQLWLLQQGATAPSVEKHRVLEHPKRLRHR